ncbi:MAG: hypothetical protein HY923_10800 [Elusimicrobia bacterium]|nr:hypothetical protein [Elusimicrobiota bacterium]
MTAKVKSVMTVASEALESAAGYALLVIGIYTAVFVDVTGGGSLWNNMRHLKEDASAGIESPNAVRVIKVPVQAEAEPEHQDRILAVFDTQPKTGEVAAVYQPAEAGVTRPSAAFTDTPADPNSGATWKRGIKGNMRTFTVYGKGEQTSSAVASRSAAAPIEPTVAAVAGTPASASATAPAAARPGMSSRLSRGALSASETSRNVR